MARKQNFNVERFFQALGDNTRLRLLNLMGEQEICVCYFVEILAVLSRRFPAPGLPAECGDRFGAARR